MGMNIRWFLGIIVFKPLVKIYGGMCPFWHVFLHCQLIDLSFSIFGDGKKEKKKLELSIYAKASTLLGLMHLVCVESESLFIQKLPVILTWLINGSELISCKSALFLRQHACQAAPFICKIIIINFMFSKVHDVGLHGLRLNRFIVKFLIP